MIKCTHQSFGRSPEQYIIRLDQNWFEFQKELYELGQKLTDDVKKYIDAHKTTPSYKNMTLSSEIDFIDLSVTGPGRAGFAIGDTDKLNQKVPYWYWINYGIAQTGTTIPGGGNFVKLGQFNAGNPKPEYGEKAGRWITGDFQEGKKYSFKPYRPMPAWHYIEYLTFLADYEVQLVVDKYKLSMEK